MSKTNDDKIINELSEKEVSLEKEIEMLNHQVKETENLKALNQEQSTKMAVLESKLDESQSLISDMKKENKDLISKADKQTKTIVTLNNDEIVNKGEIERLKTDLIEHEENFKVVQKYSEGEKSDLKEAIELLNIQLKESENDRIVLSRDIGNSEGRLNQMEKQLTEQKQAYEKLIEQSLKNTKITTRTSTKKTKQ